VRLRSGLLATVAGLCLAAGTGRSQYVEDSVDVGGAWVGGLAYNSREDVIYGVSEEGPFFAIACSTNALVSRFSLGRAYSICYNSLDNKAYCTFTGSSADSLAVIDGQAHSRVKALPMRGSSVPIWDPVANRVYVSCQTTRSVAVVDCVSDTVLMYIPVGDCPIKMYINSLRHKLYVLNSDEGSVSVVDMTTNQVIKTVEVGGIPNAGYYCRSVDKFYCGGDDEVVVLHGWLDSVVARIRVAQHSEVFAVSGSDVRRVVVASVGAGGSWLYAIDAETDTEHTVIGAAGISWNIHLSLTSDRFYCTSEHSDEVIVLSGDGQQHLVTLPVADCPYVIAESPTQKRLYVGHLGSSEVYVIRDATIPWPEGQPSKPDTVSGFRVGPSPFRDRLSIVCGTEVEAAVVRVFSDDGRLVRSLNASKSSGKVLRLTWDGRDDSGATLPPGVYVLETGSSVRAKVVKLE